jgi:hypothetical protein
MDEPALRAKIAKLDALASDRNPNEHERKVAKAKADKLREKLPKTDAATMHANIRRKYQEMHGPRMWDGRPRYREETPATVERERAAAQERLKIDRKVETLMANLTKLKPSAQIFASDLCAQWYRRHWLSAKQLAKVDELIKQAKGD